MRLRRGRLRLKLLSTAAKSGPLTHSAGCGIVPRMILKTDDRGRLTASELFRPRTAYEVTPQADGSLRVVELAEKPVPMARVKFKAGGSFECPPLMTREQVLAALRADRGRR